MSALAEARAAFAAALSTVNGYKIRPRPFTSAPKPGDGWVEVARLSPGEFGHDAVLVAVIVLGADELVAEGRLEADCVALIEATKDLLSTDVALEPTQILLGSTPVYGATLTLTTEVG